MCALSRGGRKDKKHITEANFDVHMILNSSVVRMMSQILSLTVISAIFATTSATCGTDMPIEPQPGNSESVTITVTDPNLGPVDRRFRIHIPAGYSDGNDVETPLVLDLHGWTGYGGDWRKMDDVADEDPDGGFIAIHAQGYGDPSSGIKWQSWNCSRTDGPLGPPCVLPRPAGYETQCYDTCGQCDTINSCDWTACYDDTVFMRAMVDYVNDKYCLDMDSIHLTGYSNGGMFSYYAASQLNDILASITTNAASPLLGFGDVPLDPPISLLDFHGQLDGVIPYDSDSPFANGEGPNNSVISGDLYYYQQSPDTWGKWVYTMGCSGQKPYPTDMDGIDAWSCKIWSDCVDEKEVVHCTGDYGHDYPFSQETPSYIGGVRIMWDFMKAHRKN